MSVSSRSLLHRLAVVTMPRVAAMLEAVFVCVFVRRVHRSSSRLRAHETDHGPCHRWKVKPLAWERRTRSGLNLARTGALGTTHWLGQRTPIVRSRTPEPGPL
jgi:hypothetical protein